MLSIVPSSVNNRLIFIVLPSLQPIRRSLEFSARSIPTIRLVFNLNTQLVGSYIGTLFRCVNIPAANIVAHSMVT